MKESEYKKANERIAKLSKIKEKTMEQVKEAIDLLTKVQQYDLKKR